jgi:hypothetical protein
MLMRALQVVQEGLKSQDEVRKRAMDQTVTWALAEKRDTGYFPTLMESYRDYEANLESEQTGARALALGEFAEALPIRLSRGWRAAAGAARRRAGRH